MWICIEGADGSGKSTQVSMVKELLKDKGLMVWESHVFDTLVGKRIRKYFLENELTNLEEILLLAVAREEYLNRFDELFEKYDVIITDRWLLSIKAMQGLESNDISLIEEIEQRINNRRTPDLTFILDVNKNSRRKRMNLRENSLDRIELKDDFFHERVRKNFLYWGMKQKNTYILDGNKYIDQISNDISTICLSYLEGVENDKCSGVRDKYNIRTGTSDGI